jgi:hypothetical protein
MLRRAVWYELTDVSAVYIAYIIAFMTAAVSTSCTVYFSGNSIRMMKSRRIRWAVHGEVRHTYKISVGKPERKNNSEDLKIDGRTI